MSFGVYKITNMVDKKIYIKGNGLNKHPNAILNWESVKQIRKDRSENKTSLSKLAKKYNVQKASIWKVVNNYSWKEEV